MIKRFCDRCGSEEIHATEYFNKGPAFAVYRYVVTVQAREHLNKVEIKKDYCDYCSKCVTDDIHNVLMRQQERPVWKQ